MKWQIGFNSKDRFNIPKTKMDIKRWFNEDKGGFGAFLIVIIVGLMFYAIQRKEPGRDYELSQSEIKEVTATKMEIARKNPDTPPAPPDPGTENKLGPAGNDSALVALGLVKEPEKIQVKTASIKKAKPKYTRRKLSREDVVRSKLRAGMSVNQIAKATGYEKKYIRSIKKRKVCNCK